MLSRLAPNAAVRSAISGTNAARFASAAAAPSKKDKPASKAVQDSDSFCMNLFRGKAKVEQVFPFPLNLDEERKETLQMILDPTTKFLSEVNDVVKNDENAETPMSVLKQFAELGAFGALVPAEYEGAGMNNTQMARLAEIVGSHDLGLGVIMGAHQSIGYKGILLFGTEEQKKKYLPDLATGRKFAAFCLTEPSTGSDANSVRSTARKSDDGSHYILNANKIYISNGGFADVFTVFAQMPIKQADGTTKNKVTAFIVERGFGGITNGPPEKKMGIKGSNTAVVDFENVKIPKENLLGAEGEGFKIAMNILNNGRFGIPAAMTGAMKHCIKKTIDHVTTREQFGSKLEEYGNVQEKLANMIAKQYACESILYILASNMDRGIQDYQLEAAIAKVFTSECAWFTCDEAIQVHGGMGFMKETGLERVLRDLRIFRIFEGANDIMRIFVGLTGIQHAGKHLQAQAGPSGAFDKVVDPALKKSADALDKCVSLFGRTVQDLLVKHKKGIISRQYEVVRVADAAIDIYAMAATLSRCTQTSKTAGSVADYEKKVANYFCETAAARAEANLKSVAAPNEAIVKTIAEISKGACAAGANPIAHPIDTL
ncbi:acdh-12 [Pristionchus pacificus]|uniref:Very long-chain specific acyl-CoA dehydrogenase, mitochondrial n=1 Tax=Pristionchus pacificus TaxID=54126 RepID=A0A2A6CW73_PRIPA|nr:acdh-12 [Pristionchus pacificus]|eukprot:PDM82297.1 acdh-12 [Pristionchus pacificus]